MRRRSGPEEIIHRAVVAHLRARCMPGVVWFHPGNGGYRTKAEAAGRLEKPIQKKGLFCNVWRRTHAYVPAYDRFTELSAFHTGRTGSCCYCIIAARGGSWVMMMMGG